jgi:hypothetical protein
MVQTRTRRNSWNELVPYQGLYLMKFFLPIPYTADFKQFFKEEKEGKKYSFFKTHGPRALL